MDMPFIASRSKLELLGHSPLDTSWAISHSRKSLLLLLCQRCSPQAPFSLEFTLTPFSSPQKSLSNNGKKSRPWLCNWNLRALGVVSPSELEGRYPPSTITTQLLVGKPHSPLSWSTQPWPLIFMRKMISKRSWANKARFLKGLSAHVRVGDFLKRERSTVISLG